MMLSIRTKNPIVSFCTRLVTVTCIPFALFSCSGGSTDTGPTAPVIAPPPVTTSPPSSTATPEEVLDLTLEDIRNDSGLPAVAGLLMHNDEILVNKAIGMRSAVGSSKVSPNDLWHLGSITKSMTATLAARLVEKAMIDWDTRIAQVFPGLAADGNGHFDGATLEQLLSHHSGLMRDFSWQDYDDTEIDITELRRQVVADALNSEPANGGTEMHYSNLGFVVAGAMLEAVSGNSWEELMRQELLEPLGISDAGFGAPKTSGLSPSGHRTGSNDYVPVELTTGPDDNPMVIGPAGTVHMSLASLAKYAYAHMVGELGESALLRADSFQRLHQPVFGSDYALGWFVQPDSLFHGGSNNLWYAKLSVSQDYQLVLISVTNAGGQRANAATDEITNAMLHYFFEG